MNGPNKMKEKKNNVQHQSHLPKLILELECSSARRAYALRETRKVLRFRQFDENVHLAAREPNEVYRADAAP